MTLSLRNPLTLDDLLNYRLLRLYAASAAPVTRLMEGRWGITRREWRLLALLAIHGALSPSTLAERANLDRARTSRAITSMVEKKLLQRAAQRGDARRASVVLSTAGRRLFEEIFPQVAAINARVVDALDDADVAVLDRVLTRLTARAVKLNGEIAQDVSANRHAGGAKRFRESTDPDD